MAEAPVFVIVEVRQVHDTALFGEYQVAVRKQLSALGVQVLGRGGVCFEGSPTFQGLMIQQWPTEHAFREWQASSQYAPLREKRRRAASLRIAIVPQVATLNPVLGA